MALNFPTSPTNGQLYVYNNITYYWDASNVSWVTSYVQPPNVDFTASNNWANTKLANVAAGQPIAVTWTLTNGNILATVNISTSGVTTGVYGSATQIPVITVDSYGRIVLASNTDINHDYANTVGTAANNYSGLTYFAKTGGTISGNVVITNNLTLNGGLYANGGFGLAGQILASNGSAIYWATGNPVRVTTTANAAAITANVDTTDVYTVTAQAVGLTINAPVGSVVNDGQRLMYRIKDSGSARALSWNSTFRVIGLTLPTTTIASKVVYVGAVYNSQDSKWDVIAIAQE